MSLLLFVYRYMKGHWENTPDRHLPPLEDNRKGFAINPWATDAWAMVTPIKIPEESDFYFGVMGCDNGIAGLLKDTEWHVPGAAAAGGNGYSYDLQVREWAFALIHSYSSRFRLMFPFSPPSLALSLSLGMH